MALIDKATIRNFYGFQELSIDYFANINIVLGKNDSGKTGLLKLLYGISRTFVESERSNAPESQKPLFRTLLSNKISRTFTPRKNGLGDLVTKGQGEPLEAELCFSGFREEKVYLSFTEETKKEIKNSTESISPFAENFNALFIPAKEVLSYLRSIEFLQKYEFFEFDDTYFDLVEALRIPTSRGRVAEDFSEVSKRLEKLFDGKVKQNLQDEQNPYIFQKGRSIYTMPQTAEGIKKIGILSTLFNNRQLNKNTVLFMDEPETTLHPNAQRALANMLYLMSRNGIQVFLATHSYFLINEFSLIARKHKERINCISIETDENSRNRDLNMHDLKKGMPDNSIINEAIEMFKEDTKTELGL